MKPLPSPRSHALQRLARPQHQINTRPTKMTTIDPAQNPKVEHHIREFLKTLNSGGGKPIEALTPAEARKVLVDVQASVPLDLPACDVQEKTITHDGLKVGLTIVRPAGCKEILPAFIFIHGGGWILGDFPTHERFVRDLVADSGFTAVFVNYTPSPRRITRPRSTKSTPPRNGWPLMALRSRWMANGWRSWVTASVET